jgi:Bacterial Ig-like domain (group 3)/Right handed beta helix region
VIDGPGAGVVTISGGDAVGVFQVEPGVVVALSGLTISGGSVAGGEGGGIYAPYGSTVTIAGSTIAGNSATAGYGGGIYNNGDLRITGCTIMDNSATGSDGGGGIYNDGNATVSDSTIEDNTVGGNVAYGGGIYNDGTMMISDGSTVAGNTSDTYGGGIEDYEGTLTIGDSTVEGNTAGYGGGGIQSNGTVTISDCTIEGNTAVDAGGGIQDGGTMTVTNSTIAGNSATAGYGGGVYSAGLLSIVDSNITDNSAGVDDGGIYSNGTMTVNGSTIAGNTAIVGEGVGGGIGNAGMATVTDSTIDDNSAGYYGGGIVNSGTLTVSASTVDGNTGSVYGGGIENYNGTLTVCTSTLDGNTAYYGGGIDNAGGTVTVSASTLGGNAAGYGGGISIDGGTVTVTNSTIAGNSALYGGGIDNAATLTVVNTTIAYNQVGAYGTGGGLYDSGGATTTLYNTIVAVNTAGGGTGIGDDIAGSGVSPASANNLVGVDESGSLTSGTNGNLVGVSNPGLAPGLANNGGPTQTIALLDGSPAIGAGSIALAVDPTSGLPLTYDQRGPGYPRFVNGTVDVGAVERFIATTTTLSTSLSSRVSGQSVTFDVAVTAPPFDAGIPTGTVTIYDGKTALGSAMLTGGRAAFSTTALPVGVDVITAVYSGDSSFATSTSAALTQVVNKDRTTTVASASPAFANVAQKVTFTATVTANTPGSGTPTGAVDFFDTTTNTDLTPGGVSLSSGTATFSTTSLAVGSHTIKATYSGDTNFLTSTGTTGTVTIGQSIFVLDPSAGGALSLSGNASIKLTGGVYVDSTSASALSASGNAAIKASVIDVHGGVSKSGNASFSPAPVTGAAVLADPLASLAEPSTTGLSNYGSESLSGNSSATIKPGIYSQISVSGNGTLTLCSGLYIIEGGGFSVSGNASVVGSGVTIFNAGSKYPTTGGTYGSITLSGNGSYNLSPPTSGTYAGIVIFQSRDNCSALTLSGNASGMTGTVYAPAAQLAESGNAQLNAAVIVDTMTVSGNGVSNTVALSSPAGTVAYTPAEIRSAYGISALGLDGTGQTIAIVDAYDDPDILEAADAFDTEFGLTASGPKLYAQYGPASSFLTVLNQYGQATSLPTTDPSGPGTSNSELEEALDVEWAHAVAPGAQIILVEANSQSLSDLVAAAATAASQPGVSVVSMSWGFPEGQAVFAADEAAYDSVFNVPGVTFVASTGDYGAADPEYPAYSPNVVAVGGTSLTLNGDGSYNSETGWGYYSDSVGAFIGSGGGISLYEPEPAYQQGVQSSGYRTTPDVSLVADPATGAWIADSYNLDPSSPFEVVGGTSLSAPAWAGLFALVNQGRAAAGESTLNSATPTDAQQALYMLPQSDYNAITTGTNGYTASAGYNLVTGLGTPVANLLAPDLVAYQGPSTAYAGSPVAPLQNAGLVDSGTTDSGPMDVFSVFDALTVGGDDPRVEWYSSVPETQAVAEAIHATQAQGPRILVEPVSFGAGGMIPLDATAAVDAVLIGWSPVAASPGGGLPIRRAATAGMSVSVGTSLIFSGRSRTAVLDAASVDAVLGDARGPRSLLDFNGKRVKVGQALA